MNRPKYVDRKGYSKCATAYILAAALLFLWGAGAFGVGAQSPRLSAAEQASVALAAAFAASEAAIDLSAYGLTPAEMCRIYSSCLEDDPALFYVAPRLSYTYREIGEGAEVLTVCPVYTLSGASLAEARDFFATTVAEILSEIESVFAGHPHTEAEVALCIHEILCERYDYDTRTADGGKSTTAYTLFKDGTGVCQAYAMASLALLRGAGLAAEFVASGEMDHAWVRVRIGDAWYHMDATRDDPIPAAGGDPMVTHSRFLRSDMGLVSLGYRGFSTGRPCTDGRYEVADDGGLAGALDVFCDPLRPVSVGRGLPLVWVGAGRDGEPLAVRFSEAGITIGAPGDIDGDGDVTPADLLFLSDPSIPETLREWVRGILTKKP